MKYLMTHILFGLIAIFVLNVIQSISGFESAVLVALASLLAYAMRQDRGK